MMDGGANSINLQQFPAGSVLIPEGGKLNTLFVLRDGEIEVTRDGLVARAENRAMVEVLSLDLVPVEDVEWRSGDAVVSVLSVRVEGDVRAVYITVNPDKLVRWAAVDVE